MKAPKELLRTALTIAVLTTGAWAQTQTASNASPASSPAATPATTSPDSEIRSELEQLKQLVREQQQRIDALEAGHKEEPVPSATTAPVANPSPVADPVPVVTANRIEASYPQPAIAPQPSAQPAIAPLPSAEPSTTSAPSPQKVSQAQTVQAGSSDERIRNLERQIQGLGPISFSGDVRLRAEPFFGGPANESLDRVRGRVRARFNAFANLGSQFRAGISLASGDINNPISTNQDLTGFYSRKPVALDLAFVEYTPDHFKNLTLVGESSAIPGTTPN